MNVRKLTNNDELQAQIDDWLKSAHPEFVTESQMAKETLVEYMRMYEEHLYCDGDVLMEFYRQCKEPENFWLEIVVGGTRDGVQIAGHVFSAEPSATYDNALATFKDALAQVKNLGWEHIEPTLKWSKADETSCANGKDVIEEMFPVIAGWETENPKTGRMLPSKVTFSRECFETLRNEIKSAEYTLGVQHKQNVEEPLREELERLREENKALKEERKELRSRLCKEVGRYNNQETRHEQELEVTRNSWTVLLDICDNPRLPTDTEEQVAMSVARNVLHGEKLDIECFKDLAREKGLVLSTILVEGIKRG